MLSIFEASAQILSPLGALPNASVRIVCPLFSSPVDLVGAKAKPFAFCPGLVFLRVYSLPCPVDAQW